MLEGVLLQPAGLKSLNKFLIVTSKGLEEVCKLELISLGLNPIENEFGFFVEGNKNPNRNKLRGIFNVSNPHFYVAHVHPSTASREVFLTNKDLIKSVHSALFILEVLNEGEDVIKLAKIISLPKVKSFVVRCTPSNSDLEKDIGAAILENYPLKVKFDSPDLLIRVLKKDQYLIGIDHAQIKLNHRAYKVFATRNSLSPVTSFALGCSFKETKDLFILTSDGLPLIEAAMAKGNVDIIRDPNSLKPDSLEDKSKIGVGLNRVIVKGARQNALLACAPVTILDTSWEETIDKSFNRVIVALNFKVNTDGLSSKTLFLEIAKKLPEKTELIVLSKNGFESDLLEKISTLEFMQGKLALQITSFKSNKK